MTQKNVPAVKQMKSEIESVFKQRVESGLLQIPKDFSGSNAVTFAFMELESMEIKGKPVLDVCTPMSVKKSVLEMLYQGLTTQKKQVYFIPYGNTLTCQRSVFGNIALAKRFGGVKDVIAHVIYQGDKFEYRLNVETGRKEIVNHEQKLENLDGKIIGAYAYVIFDDGRPSHLEIMTMKEIEAAWNQGQMKGQSGAHKNFTQEMVKKSVITRACKPFINSSGDGSIVDNDDRDIHVENRDEEIHSEANQEELNIDDVETVEAEEVQPEPEDARDETPPPPDPRPEPATQGEMSGPGF